MQITSYLQELMEIGDFYRWCFVVFIYSFVSSYINLFLFTTIFNVKSNNPKNIKFLLTDGAIRLITAIFIPLPYYRVIVILSTIILLKSFYKQSIEKCALNEAISLMIYIIPELVFSKIFQLILKNPINYINGMYDYVYMFVLTFFVSIFRVIICFIIKKYNITIKISTKLSGKNKNNITLIALTVCMILLLNMVEITMPFTNLSHVIFFLDILAMILYFRLSLSSIIEIMRCEEQNLKIFDLELYNKTLTDMCDEVRGFKHDFCNFVQALDGYVKNKDIDGISRMCTALKKECKSVATLEGLTPKTINNPAVYSIVASKYFLAQEYDITMNIESCLNFENVNIDEYNLCKILAILLDNAIEASRECKEKVINLYFLTEYRNHRKIIVVENTYSQKNVDLDKIFEKGYSTKENKTRDHGLGLWNVRKILKHSTNLNLYTAKGELFKQQLEIYD